MNRQIDRKKGKGEKFLEWWGSKVTLRLLKPLADECRITAALPRSRNCHICHAVDLLASEAGTMGGGWWWWMQCRGTVSFNKAQCKRIAHMLGKSMIENTEATNPQSLPHEP